MSAITVDQTTNPAIDAFQHCREIVRHHAKSFYFCSHFLPVDKRSAMFAIYALCRTLDDTVDAAPPGEIFATKQALDHWRAKLDLLYGNIATDDPILRAMRVVLARYPVRKELFLDLIAGVEMDLDECRYQTFEELKLYCYRVASTVGLMGSEVFGYRDKSALPYAEALGIGMQLTNILRDVGEDLRLNRIYLPAEDLARFNYSEADLRANIIDERFIALMKFEIARARGYYQQADIGIRLLSPDSRLTVLLASRLYGAILDQIERNGYDVFSRRASLSLLAKLGRLPGIWLTRRWNFNS